MFCLAGGQKEVMDVPSIKVGVAQHRGTKCEGQRMQWQGTVTGKATRKVRPGQTFPEQEKKVAAEPGLEKGRILAD